MMIVKMTTLVDEEMAMATVTRAKRMMSVVQAQAEKFKHQQSNWQTRRSCKLHHKCDAQSLLHIRVFLAVNTAAPAISSSINVVGSAIITAAALIARSAE